MNDFWTNISRYPRFFISSLFGLVLIILKPFTNLLKVQKFRVILFIFFLFLVITLYNVLIKMVGL